MRPAPFFSTEPSPVTREDNSWVISFRKGRLRIPASLVIPIADPTECRNLKRIDDLIRAHDKTAAKLVMKNMDSYGFGAFANQLIEAGSTLVYLGQMLMVSRTRENLLAIEADDYAYTIPAELVSAPLARLQSEEKSESSPMVYITPEGEDYDITHRIQHLPTDLEQVTALAGSLTKNDRKNIACVNIKVVAAQAFFVYEKQAYRLPALPQLTFICEVPPNGIVGYDYGKQWLGKRSWPAFFTKDGRELKTSHENTFKLFDDTIVYRYELGCQNPLARELTVVNHYCVLLGNLLIDVGAKIGKSVLFRDVLIFNFKQGTYTLQKTILTFNDKINSRVTFSEYPWCICGQDKLAPDREQYILSINLRFLTISDAEHSNHGLMVQKILKIMKFRALLAQQLPQVFVSTEFLLPASAVAAATAIPSPGVK